ncbi:putative serine protease K12H4.7 [Choristoneura fumiferana]|uniref:putative serine protease K12H4.7 n=1 Tax=Choristoneura fumiferana TaxID=7141 RepID=UPI003D15A417
MIAAWMRLLYPDLVDAALSSSAPVLAKKDFYEYLETVRDTYEKYGSTDCVNKICIFFKRIVEFLKNSSGIDTLKKELNICNESDMNVAHKKLWFSTWVYQESTEFGYFATTTSDKQPFTHNLPLDFWVKQCQAVFGEVFNEKRVDDGVTQTNAMYGGITPNVTNVVFTH